MYKGLGRNDSIIFMDDSTHGTYFYILAPPVSVIDDVEWRKLLLTENILIVFYLFQIMGKTKKIFLPSKRLKVLLSHIVRKKEIILVVYIGQNKETSVCWDQENKDPRSIQIIGSFPFVRLFKHLFNFRRAKL